MTETLDSAERINLALSRVLNGEYPDDRRVTITVAYCNLAMDHHTAIILLFRNRIPTRHNEPRGSKRY